MDSVKVSDEVTSTTSLVSRAFIGVTQSWCCSKNAGMFLSGTHFAVSAGFRRRVRRGGVLVGVPERACGGVFTTFSGGARVHTSTTFVCRPCLVWAWDISHGTHITAVRLQTLSFMILCHIARQARHFWKNLFYGVFGGLNFGMLLWRWGGLIE